MKSPMFPQFQYFSFLMEALIIPAGFEVVTKLDSLLIIDLEETNFDIIIHRNDDAYLASRVNYISRIALVREAMAEVHIRLVNRMIEAVS